jgi:hypothetical protein
MSSFWRQKLDIASAVFGAPAVSVPLTDDDTRDWFLRQIEEEAK